MSSENETKSAFTAFEGAHGRALEDGETTMFRIGCGQKEVGTGTRRSTEKDQQSGGQTATNGVHTEWDAAISMGRNERTSITSSSSSSAAAS